MNYKTTMYKRKYQDIKEFFDMVNEEMNTLKNSGAKKISVQYLKNTGGEIDTAIITYLI